MIDSALSLAISVQAAPGVFALLIGSGVSRSASILTGWEITLDLARRVAAGLGEDSEPDPAEWFGKRFGVEPAYSELLRELSKSAAVRSRLLQGYFEPSSDELAEGIKSPTPAHKSVARLAAGGHIRVILTTNFDPLTEHALDAAGVAYTVISTPDGARGAMPLTQGGVFVIKLHGDYRDPRILNTETELATYKPAVNRLLDRVLDEFGLIVVGWSGEWDGALRNRMERANRRFPTFWAVRDAPKAAAAQLIQLRGADVIEIIDADAFLTQLADRVQALEEVRRAHPASVAVAIAQAKGYLARGDAIALTDLLLEETERVWKAVGGQQLGFSAGTISEEIVRSLVARAAVAEETLMSLLATVACLGNAEHERMLARVVERFANPSSPTAYLNPGNDPSFLPALLALYSAGVGAVAASNYGALRSVLVDASIHEYEGDHAVGRRLQPAAVLNPTLAGKLDLTEGTTTPMSTWLHQQLWSPLKHLFVSQDEYTRAFDRFEYLASLVYADLSSEEGEPFAPIGCFLWRRGARQLMDQELLSYTPDWGPFAAGLFGGDIGRLSRAATVLLAAITQRGWG